MSSLRTLRSPARNRAEPLPMKRKNPKPLRPLVNAETDKGTDVWLITLSDLLMLLVIFFVILFSIELQKRAPNLIALAAPQANPAERQAAAEPPAPGMSAVVEKDLIAALNPDKDRQGVTVERVADLVTLTFPERIVFDPGHARLKPSAQATLDKVGAFIRERPHLAVEVQGHTDDRPISSARYPSNWELSVDRAAQVARALIGLGVDPTRLSVKGYGEYRPLRPNDSDENRLRNRRVEIQFSIPPQRHSG